MDNMVTLNFIRFGLHPVVVYTWESKMFQIMNEMKKLNKELDWLWKEISPETAQLN